MNARLRDALKGPELDVERTTRAFERARADGVSLDAKTLGYTIEKTLEALAERVFADPAATVSLSRLEEAVRFARSLPFEIRLWRPQNRFFSVVRDVLPVMRERADAGEHAAIEWLGVFSALGEALKVRVP
jgi:hypothetical protein